MSRGIRRYGPGKFNTILDSYLYDMTLEGTCESVGDVSEVGFFANKVELGPEVLSDVEKIAAAADSDSLTPEEKDLIKESVGAIVVESEQGLVTVDYYDNEEEFEKDWEEVQDDASTEEEEEEDGEESEEEEAEEEDAETEEAE
jgi:hypothetical protein